MTKLNDISSLRAILGSRRSASAKAMGGPGPTPEQLDEILRHAVRVPDHGKLHPWRFIIFEGDARSRFGDAMVARWKELYPTHGENTLKFVHGLFLRAPMVLAVVSTAQPHPKIPEWEQQLSAGAVCQTILLAATALGIDCQWNTDWLVYDAGMQKVMGLEPHEKIAGFIYLGSTTEALEDRERPDPAGLTSRWGAP